MKRRDFLALGATAVALGGCDYMPDYVKAFFGKSPVSLKTIGNSSFSGQLKVLFLEPKTAEDRSVQLLEDFGFKDSKGVEWLVPAGTTSDGASIPWSLWSFIGGPFDGPYRDAAVIHDYYCIQRTRTWEDVHKMFLEASLRRGVPESTAQTMYAGILYGGPRWDPPKSVTKAQVIPVQTTTTTPPPIKDKGITKRAPTAGEKADADELKRWIEQTKPTPEQIMKKVEEMRKAKGK